MTIRRGIGLSATLLCVIQTTFADPVIVQPRVSVGTQNYEMSIDDITTTASNGNLSFRDGFKVSDSIAFRGAGITVSAGRFFADLSGQWSETGNDQTFIFQGTAGTPSTNVGHNHSLDAAFKRDEFNATLGWGITPEFSAYLGYKRATLDMTQARAPVLDPGPVAGDVLQLGNYFMDFTYKGFFVGATYSIPMKTWGSFSIQSSIARLDSSFDQRFEGVVAIYTPPGVFALDPSYITNTVDGKSTGFNIGVSWTSSFGWVSESLERFSYTIGIDRSAFDFDSDSGAASSATSGADLEEKNTRVRLDLRYRFNVGQ